MKRKFSIALSLAVVMAIALTSLALAAVQPAYITFTTDAPCAVTVIVTSYTNPANQSGQTASGSTPWMLDTYPSTSVTFFYPASIVCNGVTYNFVSASPSSPLTSGSSSSPTTVTGHYTQYVPDNTPPVWSVPANFSVEATGPSGASVTYSASASDPDDAVNSQSCSPVSGSTFPLGTTTVNCIATDTHGNTATANFSVTVVDTTPPVLTLPSNITVTATSLSGATVNFTASANDLVDGSLAVTCLPASGSTFSVGMTTVNCSALDAHKNTAHGSFTITVNPISDTTPPVWSVPANFSVEATAAGGASVIYSASANDPDDAVSSQSCSPASGTTFPLGMTTVHCSATDTHGNTGTASFNVTVVDTTSPVLTLPGNMIFNASGNSEAVVNFTATATDLVDGSVAVTCLPASGSTFPVGTTTVNCSASDSHGNTANGSFTVTVTAVVSDTTPPVWKVPASMSVEATGPSGAVVTYSALASDPDDVVNSQSCSPASGSIFKLGTTMVNCTATDTQGNTGIASFNVTVVDTTPPALTLPSNMTVNATSSSGAVANFIVSATDLVDGSVPVTCLPASSSTFPVGTTTINCSASDAHANTAHGSFTITVKNIVSDTTPPVWTVPANFSVEATGPTGATVNYTASASDPDDTVSSQSCSPVSGSVFHLGKTTVQCTATDTHENTSTAQFDITVRDTTPPVLTLPSNIVVTTSTNSGTVVNFSVSANDLVDGLVAVTCSPASGSTLPIGTTTVNCSATDSSENTSTGNFKVTVQRIVTVGKCKDGADFEILQPINQDGSAVFKQGSVIPVKIRVCDGKGKVAFTPDLIQSIRLVKIISKGNVATVDQPVLSVGRDGVFRAGNQQWVFNLGTKNLQAGNAYVYLVTLNNGATIQFQFSLK